MNRRRTASLVAFAFLAFSSSLHAVDEIEILELAPTPPATLDGIATPAPGEPLPPISAANGLTVVVRYRSDGEATSIHAFADPASGPGWHVSLVTPFGPVARCGTLSGPSEGTCAEAFAILCDDGAPATVTVDVLVAALGVLEVGGRVLARDTTKGRYTFRCPGVPPPPPPHDEVPCRVIGAAGAPGESDLPFPAHFPICRCLRDAGAREFRCGLLHPDFFLVRRVPLPLVPGKEVSEVWELLPLTKLESPIRVTFEGGGLAAPVERTLGEPEKLRPGTVERFALKIVAPQKTAELAGLARFEYGKPQSASDLAHRFSVDRTIAKSMFEEK